MRRLAERLPTVALMILIVALVGFSSKAQDRDPPKVDIHLLIGDRFELGAETRWTATLEAFNRWRFGDIYAFLDVSHTSNEAAELYLELAPHLSVSKLTGRAFRFRFVKDVSFASGLELGDGVETYLLGLGFDVDLRMVDFLRVSFLWRDESMLPGSSYQLTTTWISRFQVGNLTMEFRGFFDFATSEGPKTWSLLAQPQLLVDLGTYFDRPGQLFVGIETQIWRHKFGLRDVDEFVPQVMIKLSL